MSFIFPFTPEDNNARAKGDHETSVYVLLWAIWRSERRVAFNSDEMCFNLVRGDLSVGGDNDNFICIALFRKQSLQSAGGKEKDTDSRLDE